jgi:hypothetical protein
MPVAIILAMSRRLSVMLRRATSSARRSARMVSARAANSSARAMSGPRSKPNACSTSPGGALARETLAVRAVAPQDQSALDQHGEMAAQRRGRDAVSPQHQRRVRWEDDEVAGS